jgi:hypothetical protein
MFGFIVDSSEDHIEESVCIMTELLIVPFNEKFMTFFTAPDFFVSRDDLSEMMSTPHKVLGNIVDMGIRIPQESGIEVIHRIQMAIHFLKVPKKQFTGCLRVTYGAVRK